MDRETYLKEEAKIKKENLLARRACIKDDLNKLSKKPYWGIEDSDLITEMIIQFKTKQIEEIDKLLGI